MCACCRCWSDAGRACVCMCSSSSTTAAAALLQQQQLRVAPDGSCDLAIEYLRCCKSFRSRCTLNGMCYNGSIALQKSGPPNGILLERLVHGCRIAIVADPAEQSLRDWRSNSKLHTMLTDHIPTKLLHAPLTLSTSDCILFRKRGRSRHSFRSLEKTERRGKIAWMAAVWMVHGALLLWQLRRGVRIRRQDGQFVAHLHFEQHRTLRKLDSCRIAGKERSAA